MSSLASIQDRYSVMSVLVYVPGDDIMAWCLDGWHLGALCAWASRLEGAWMLAFHDMTQWQRKRQKQQSKLTCKHEWHFLALWSWMLALDAACTLNAEMSSHLLLGCCMHFACWDVFTSLALILHALCMLRCLHIFGLDVACTLHAEMCSHLWLWACMHFACSEVFTSLAWMLHALCMLRCLSSSLGCSMHLHAERSALHFASKACWCLAIRKWKTHMKNRQMYNAHICSLMLYKSTCIIKHTQHVS